MAGGVEDEAALGEAGEDGRDAVTLGAVESGGDGLDVQRRGGFFDDVQDGQHLVAAVAGPGALGGFCGGLGGRRAGGVKGSPARSLPSRLYIAVSVAAGVAAWTWSRYPASFSPIRLCWVSVAAGNANAPKHFWLSYETSFAQRQLHLHLHLGLGCRR